MEPVLLIVFYLLFYIALTFIFLFYYYRAIRYTGLNKLKTFTERMLLVFGITMLLSRFVPPSMFSKLPLGVLLVFTNDDGYNYPILTTMIFFVYALTNIHKEEKPRLLMASWLVIGLLNIADILLSVYYYITYTPTDSDGSFAAKMMEHVMQRVNFLFWIFYPACWVVVSSVSLLKIRKENRRSLAVQAASVS